MNCYVIISQDYEDVAFDLHGVYSSFEKAAEGFIKVADKYITVNASGGYPGMIDELKGELQAIKPLLTIEQDLIEFEFSGETFQIIKQEIDQ